MLLGVMGVGFENTYTVYTEKWNEDSGPVQYLIFGFVIGVNQMK